MSVSLCNDALATRGQGGCSQLISVSANKSTYGLEEELGGSCRGTFLIEMFDVREKAVIVTGGSRGFGKEYARELLKAGAKVCIGDVLVEVGRETEKELAKEYGEDRILFVKCNVVNEEDWKQLWDATEQKFGYVSVVINNAGVHPRHGWKACIDVMVSGVMIGSTMAMEKMSTKKGGKGGRIINTASIVSLVHTWGGGAGAHYAAAKFAVAAHSRVLGCTAQGPSLFESDGIKCYTLCPFLGNTSLVGTPDDVATISTAIKERALQPEELGRALMTALKADRNGACLVVYPDCPLLEIPNLNDPFVWKAAALGQALTRWGFAGQDSVLGARTIVGIMLLAFVGILYIIQILLGIFF